MKQLVKKDCQLKLGKRITYCYKGTVVSTRQKHPCLEPLCPEYTVDFDTATKEELENTKWYVSDAKDWLKLNYNIEIRNNMKREKVIDKILDARFREV